MISPEIEALAWAFITLAFGATVRWLGLAALCGIGSWVLRFRTAELRFAFWRWLLLALFALPVLLALTPPLDHPSRALTRAEIMVLPAASAGVVSTGSHKKQLVAPPPEKARVHTWIVVPVVLYFVVTVFLLVRLAINLRRLAALARGSTVISEPAVGELIHQIWLESGAKLEPRIAESYLVCVPVTFEPLAFDLDEPWILLPPSWHEWD